MFFTKSKGNIYSNTSYSGSDIFASISIGGNGTFPGGSYVIGELQTLSYSLHMERGTVRSCGNINAKDYTDGPRTIAGTLIFAVFDKHFVRNVLKAAGINTLTTTILTDELPPFDITITYANEYGHKSVMRIYGIKLVNEGMVMSINDILTENSYQYVARNISPINTVSDQYGSEETEQTTEETAEDREATYNDLLLKNEPFLDVYSLKEASKDEEGVVYLNIINPLETNTVAIYQEEAEIKKYTILSNDIPFSISLPAGIYTFSMLDESGSKISNSITIEIVLGNNQEVMAPTIQYITQSIISGMTTDKNAYKIVCFNEEESYEAKIKNSDFAFNKLKPDTTYTLYVITKDNEKSPNISVTTNINAQDRFLEWKEFILSNKNNIEKEYLDHFLESFDKILILAKETSYTKSLTYYYYTLKSTYQKNSLQYIATDYFTKEANIYELKNLFSVFNYNMETDDYYNNQIRISKAATKLYLTNNSKTTQISINCLQKNNSYYLYTFPNEPGIYTIKQIINNSVEQKIDYYVAEDFTRTNQSENNANKAKDFGSVLDKYYNENLGTIGNKSIDDDYVVQGAFNQNVSNVLTAISIKEQDDKSVFIEKSSVIDKDCYVIFSTYKDLIQNSFINRIAFSKDISSIKVDFKSLILNKKGTYFVYLEDMDGNIITKSILLKTSDIAYLTKIQKELFLKSLDQKYISTTLKVYIEEVMENEYINNNDILEDTKELILSLKQSAQKDKDLCNIINLLAQNNTSKIFQIKKTSWSLVVNKNSSISIKSSIKSINRIIYGHYDTDFNLIQKELAPLEEQIEIPYTRDDYYICFAFIEGNMQSQFVLFNTKTKLYFY